MPEITKSRNHEIKILHVLHVSGQLLPFNGQPDLLSHLRDHSAIFAGFGDDFDTLEMSLERLYRALYDRKTSGNGHNKLD